LHCEEKSKNTLVNQIIASMNSVVTGLYSKNILVYSLLKGDFIYYGKILGYGLKYVPNSYRYSQEFEKTYNLSKH